MATFSKGQVVKLKSVIPQGPITKMRMDDDGKVWYLVSWTVGDIEHERWFDDEQIELAE
jgi:hypothetical protein